MKYDLTLKELFQQIPQKLFTILIGQQPTEMLKVEYPTVKERRPDLVCRLEDNSIYHLEIQSDNDETMPLRMLEYFILIRQQYKQPIIQQVLYVGREKMTMSNRIEERTLQFHYELINIQQIDCHLLLQSPSVEDNILALLCRMEQSTEMIQTILGKIAQLHVNARRDALEKLQILVGLRGMELQQILNREIKKMPISVDMRNTVWYQEVFSEGRLEGEQKGRLEGKQEGKQEGRQEGKQEGESRLLQRLLIKRFGVLPDWARERIEQANIEQLEQWSLRMLEVNTLEEVFT